jgi:hypothetical protein
MNTANLCHSQDAYVLRENAFLIVFLRKKSKKNENIFQNDENNKNGTKLT